MLTSAEYPSFNSIQLLRNNDGTKGATPEENRKEPTVWGAVELKIAPKITQSKRGRFTHRDWLQPLKWRRIPLEDECWESDNHLDWKDISLLTFGAVQNYRCLSLVVDDVVVVVVVVVVVAVVVAHLPRTVDSPRHESHLATRSCFVHRQSGSSNRLKNAWAITDQAMKTAVIFGTVSAPILNHGFHTLEWELRDVFEKIVVEFVNTSCAATC